MKPELYMKTQMAIMSIGKQASVLPIEAFLNLISRSQAVAPMVDPTLYRKAQDNLEAIKALAKTVLAVQSSFEQLLSTTISTAAQDAFIEQLPPEISE